MPKVSVVMPMHNALAYVGEAIESILQQTLKSFELLIIDDASNDGCTEIAHAYAVKDSRIKLITNPIQRGAGLTRNVGIEHAKSEYVIMMDADDISAPERLALQVAFMDAHPKVAMSGCWAKEFGETKWLYAYFASQYMIDTLTPFRYAFHGPTIIFRKSAVSERYDGRAIGEDTLFTTRVQLHHRTANLCKILYLYRVHAASLTKRSNVEQGLKQQFAESFALIYGFTPTQEELHTHLCWLSLAQGVGLLAQWRWILRMAKHPKYRWHQRIVLIGWCVINTVIKITKPYIKPD